MVWGPSRIPHPCTGAVGAEQLSRYYTMQIFQYGSEDPVRQLPMILWIVRMVHVSFIILPSFSSLFFCTYPFVHFNANFLHWHPYKTLFFTVGEPGFVPVVLTQLHKSLALLVLDHPIVLQPLAMEGYKCTPSSRMWASVYVHLILLPAYERVTVTDLLFKKKLFFFDLVRMLYGGLGAMREKPPKREIIMRHVTRTHHKDRYSF